MKEILVGSISFVLAYFFFPLYINFLTKKELRDKPGGRRIHSALTPSMGGLPIVFAAVLSSLIFLSFKSLIDFKYVFVAICLVSIVGLRDDYSNLKPYKKIIGQLIAIFLVVVLTDIRLTSFYGLFGIEEISVYLSYPLTFAIFIVLTNSYNLIDGIDGLAGSIGLIALLFFACWFYLAEYEVTTYVCLAFVSAILAFLRFNWQPSKIFMGDTGSLTIGFVISIMVIAFLESNHALDDSSNIKFTAPISMVLALLIIPLYDTLRVFIRRVYNKRSPFSADKTHLHHLLLRLGLSHSKATSVFILVTITFVSIAYLGRNLNDEILIPIISLLIFLCGVLLNRKFLKKINHRKEELKERNETLRKGDEN